MGARAYVAILLLLVNRAVALDADAENLSAVAETKRLTAVQEEIKNLPDHPWAGYYSGGYGLLSTHLSIAQNAGYVYAEQGCIGPAERNFGAAVWTNNRILLSFTLESRTNGPGFASELIPVSWGRRHYLIPLNEMVKFCNQVCEGREPRSSGRGYFLLRQGDETNLVGGLPDVPQEFHALLPPKPVEARIAATGASSRRPIMEGSKTFFRDTPVQLDAGRKDGLRPGMELWVRQPGHTKDFVRVTSVEDSQAEGILTQLDEAEPPPEVGWRLGTRVNSNISR